LRIGILYTIKGRIVIQDKKVAVVLPAYEAERTLERTYHSMPFSVVDSILFVDDASTDGGGSIR
jgi:glycosyltransferase involved in cell wall biosynthesis